MAEYHKNAIDCAKNLANNCYFLYLGVAIISTAVYSLIIRRATKGAAENGGFMKMFQAIIRQGTLVQRDDSRMIRLACDVIVEGGRDPLSECFRYSYGGHEYETAWGLVEIGKEVDRTTEPCEVWSHQDGLVVFAI